MISTEGLVEAEGDNSDSSMHDRRRIKLPIYTQDQKKEKMKKRER